MPNGLALLKEGDECCYTQDGGQYRVKILKQWSFGDFLYFKLEVLYAISPVSSILKNREIGEIFEVGKKVGCSLAKVSWEITPIR